MKMGNLKYKRRSLCNSKLQRLHCQKPYKQKYGVNVMNSSQLCKNVKPHYSAQFFRLPTAALAQVKQPRLSTKHIRATTIQLSSFRRIEDSSFHKKSKTEERIAILEKSIVDSTEKILMCSRMIHEELKSLPAAKNNQSKV